MAVLDFLARRPNSVITVFFIDHGTDESREGWNCIFNYITSTIFTVAVATERIELRLQPGLDVSLEARWRKARYKAFAELHKDLNQPIITAHHLDDCVEEYLISMCKRGRCEIIPYRDPNNIVIRPFRLVKKATFVDYCLANDIEFADSSINDLSLRGRIRKSNIIEAMNKALLTNVETIVRKMILKEFISNDTTRPRNIRTPN